MSTYESELMEILGEPVFSPVTWHGQQRWWVRDDGLVLIEKELRDEMYIVLVAKCKPGAAHGYVQDTRWSIGSRDHYGPWTTLKTAMEVGAELVVVV